MSYLPTFLVALSLAAFTLLIAYRGARDGVGRAVYLHLAGVALVFVFLRWQFGFPEVRPVPRPRGEQGHDALFIVLLYGCMLLGMLAQYAFQRFERPKARRAKFDVGVFLAPVFASPVVFIPLMAALQKVELDLGDLDTATTMIFFVAFQNGFFWKEYFDHRNQARGEIAR